RVEFLQVLLTVQEERRAGDRAALGVVPISGVALPAAFGVGLGADQPYAEEVVVGRGQLPCGLVGTCFRIRGGKGIDLGGQCVVEEVGQWLGVGQPWIVHLSGEIGL